MRRSLLGKELPHREWDLSVPGGWEEETVFQIEEIQTQGLEGGTLGDSKEKVNGQRALCPCLGSRDDPGKDALTLTSEKQHPVGDGEHRKCEMRQYLRKINLVTCSCGGRQQCQQSQMTDYCNTMWPTLECPQSVVFKL